MDPKASCAAASLAFSEVDRRNGVGQTALMMAALFNQAAIIDLLIEQGADPAVVDAAGNSVASLAMSQGNAALAARFAEGSHASGSEIQTSSS